MGYGSWVSQYGCCNCQKAVKEAKKVLMTAMPAGRDEGLENMKAMQKPAPKLRSKGACWKTGGWLGQEEALSRTCGLDLREGSRDVGE
jgi:hypothetical protein